MNDQYQTIQLQDQMQSVAVVQFGLSPNYANVTSVKPSLKQSSPFRDTIEAGAYLRLDPKTLRNYRSLGKGPQFRKHGKRVLYHIDDLRKWSDERKRSYA